MVANRTELGIPEKMLYFRSLSLSFFEGPPDKLAEAHIACELKNDFQG
jgi:hypothetical protein